MIVFRALADLGAQTERAVYDEAFASGEPLRSV
jgi:hypothetical protein